MSLVNQVLRDLQHRRTASPVTDGLLAASVDNGRRMKPRWIIVGVVGAVVLGVLAFAAQRAIQEPATVSAPVERPQAPATAVESVPEPATGMAAEVEPPPVIASAPDTRAATEPAPDPTAEPVPTVADVPAPTRAQAEPAMTRTLVPSTPRSRALDAYSAGVDALREGRRTTAAARLREAVAHDATLTDARLLLAETLAGNGEMREAEIVLQAGLAIAPNPAPIAERYARLLLERGDLGGALGVLGESAPAVADAPDYHALYAAVQQRAGNHTAAAATYSALVALRPDAGLWWVGLGISLEAQSRFDEAASAYGKASIDARLRPEVARFVHERLETLSQ